MKFKALMLVMVATSTMLVSCDKVKGLVGGKPSGQVVATVGGEEITALELRAEMAGFASRDPKVMKQAQQQALQQIIMRKLVAQKAKEDKLDKSSDFAVQVKRGEEGLLAQLYQRKAAAGVTAPTQQEAQAYVASHPGMFANRRVLVVSQLIAGPNKIEPSRFQPLTTLDQVRALFASEGVSFQETVATIDTLSTDPRMTDQIMRLPPGEIFVVPQRGALVFNQISQSATVPFTGDLATAYALNVLRQQRTQEALGKQVQNLRKAAEEKIVYNEAYKPEPAKAAAPGAAPAPAPKAS